MQQYNKVDSRSSKKRRDQEPRSGVKRSRSYHDTLTITFPDGSVKVTRPNMTMFDGDWKNLALSLCEGHRITWTIS